MCGLDALTRYCKRVVLITLSDLIGPHQALTDLNGLHRSQQWRRHGAGGGGAFRAIDPRRRSSPPVKIWSTHIPVPSRLMTRGRFSQIVDLFTRALFSSLLLPPPSLLHPSLAFASPPLSFPPFLLSFLSSPFLLPTLPLSSPLPVPPPHPPHFSFISSPFSPQLSTLCRPFCSASLLICACLTSLRW